jgi:hypothetical protein
MTDKEKPKEMTDGTVEECGLARGEKAEMKEVGEGTARRTRHCPRIPTSHGGYLGKFTCK